MVVVVVAAAVWKWVVEFKSFLEIDVLFAGGVVRNEWVGEWERCNAIDEAGVKKNIRKIDFNYLSKKKKKNIKKNITDVLIQKK